MENRFDVSTLRICDLQELPQGGIKIPAAIARTGVLEYLQPDGSTRLEYRPPDEVFNGDSVASLMGVPVTDLHPAGPVDKDNAGFLSVGRVISDPKQDGNLLTALLAVETPHVVEMIKSKDRREISAGYSVDLDFTPGTSPEGEKYDAVQRNIRFNHVALGPEAWGRSGPEVALRADSADQPPTPWANIDNDKEADPMAIKKTDADKADKEVNTQGDIEEGAKKPAGVKADEDEEEEPEEEKADEDEEEEPEEEKADEEEEPEEKADAKQARFDALFDENKSLKASVKALKRQLTIAKSDSVLEERITARLALIKDAKEKTGADLNTDGLSDREIKLAAIGAVRSDFKADGKSDAYIDAAFDFITPRTMDAVFAKTDAADKAESPTIETLKAERDEKLRNLHKGNK